MKGTLIQYFKLGQEGKYRVYHNQYSSNALALNKHQHREVNRNQLLLVIVTDLSGIKCIL